MPQALANVLLHIVFSTKHRKPFLQTDAMKGAMTGYLVGALANHDCPSIIVGVVADHLHILCNLSRTISIAKLVGDIKASSSERIKQEGPDVRDFYWQNGYGAFSVSQSKVPEVKEYIANQEEHHRKMSFQDELRLLCTRHGREIDERYVWD